MTGQIVKNNNEMQFFVSDILVACSCYIFNSCVGFAYHGEYLLSLSCAKPVWSHWPLWEYVSPFWKTIVVCYVTMAISAQYCWSLISAPRVHVNGHKRTRAHFHLCIKTSVYGDFLLRINNSCAQIDRTIGVLLRLCNHVWIGWVAAATLILMKVNTVSMRTASVGRWCRKGSFLLFPPKFPQTTPNFIWVF